MTAKASATQLPKDDKTVKASTPAKAAAKTTAASARKTSGDTTSGVKASADKAKTIEPVVSKVAKASASGAKASPGKTSPVKTAATRNVAAAFVAARQKMAVPIKDSGKSTTSPNTKNDTVKGTVEVADKKVKKTAGEHDTAAVPVEPVVALPVAEAPSGLAPRHSMVPRPFAPVDRGAPKVAKPGLPKGQGFKTGEFIVYPAHGVGQITAIEEQEVAGYKLELFVIGFVKDKMILKVPLPKIASVGMRKLAEPPVVKRALDTLTGRARIKRTMWSRRAQEYEAKINSGDLVAIAEVVRDLYRSDAQPEQSYSERQLYEAALDRMAREIAVVQKLTDMEALKLIDDQLQKGPRRTKVEDADLEEGDSEETVADGGIVEAA